VAEKKANRKAYVEYLTEKKFKYADYLADMAIYRMTKEEVKKRNLMIKDDKEKISQWEKIVASPARIKKELIKELNDVSSKIDDIMKKKDDARKAVYKKIAKATKKKTRKRK
jgi:DNA gyrase subunit A